jgi:hypothetical protein
MDDSSDCWAIFRLDTGITFHLFVHPVLLHISDICTLSIHPTITHKVKFQEPANLWVIPRGKEWVFKKQRERGENTPK